MPDRDHPVFARGKNHFPPRHSGLWPATGGWKLQRCNLRALQLRLLNEGVDPIGERLGKRHRLLRYERNFRVLSTC